jgi:hypothetical protein
MVAPQIFVKKSGTKFCENLKSILVNGANVTVHVVTQLVEALHYKPEGRGFDSQWENLHNSSGRTNALGSNQLTEMNTRNISWG